MIPELMSGIITLIVLHFFGDYVMQTDWMATKKSSSNKVLLIHVGVYSLPLLFMATFLGFELVLVFIAINAVAHFITDWCSSRAAKIFWERNDRHNFFVILGADQTIHLLTLIMSFAWLYGLWPN